MTRSLIALTVPAALLVGAGAASATTGWHHPPTSYQHFPVGRHVSPPSLPNTQLRVTTASPTSTRTWSWR